ncbi:MULTISPECIES: Lrp/AsnC family transcriptional regulator [unclassified Streptomyces]|uniref:Lrp/AsnC family transcriptional regulator n=1 Tax=unclassified Streptomyces TaxID=2593676 RepID=UPI0033B96458
MTSSKSTPASPAVRAAPNVDQVDRAILRELEHNSRVSVRALAESVHISRGSAYTRIERMRSEGTIRGFTTRIDPSRIGLDATAYVTLAIDQSAWRTLCERLGDVPYVEHFALVGADHDALVLVRAPDNTTLRDVVLNEIQRLPGVRSTRTWLVFEEREGRGTAIGL